MKIRKKITWLTSQLSLYFRWLVLLRKNTDNLLRGCGLNSCDIYYINLSHRIDRKSEMEMQLSGIGVVKANRFGACSDTNGALGCSRSHLALMQSYASKSNRLLMVCEDDCEFIADRECIDEVVNEFYSNSSLDVLCLAFNQRNGITISDRLQLTSDTQTTACYILKPHMIPKMIDVAKESIDKFERGLANNVAAIDVVWKRLQKQYAFAVPRTRMARQSASYSDIEGRYTEYGV